MSEKTKATVSRLLDCAVIPNSILKQELTDVQWADFGRMVSVNIFDPDFLDVLTRAGLKSKSTAEMLGYIRAFILTGVKP